MGQSASAHVEAPSACFVRGNFGTLEALSAAAQQERSTLQGMLTAAYDGSGQSSQQGLRWLTNWRENHCLNGDNRLVLLPLVVETVLRDGRPETALEIQFLSTVVAPWARVVLPTAGDDVIAAAADWFVIGAQATQQRRCARLFLSGLAVTALLRSTAELPLQAVYSALERCGAIAAGGSEAALYVIDAFDAVVAEVDNRQLAVSRTVRTAARAHMQRSSSDVVRLVDHYFAEGTLADEEVVLRAASLITKFAEVATSHVGVDVAGAFTLDPDFLDALGASAFFNACMTQLSTSPASEASHAIAELLAAVVALTNNHDARAAAIIVPACQAVTASIDVAISSGSRAAAYDTEQLANVVASITEYQLEHAGASVASGHPAGAAAAIIDAIGTALGRLMTLASQLPHHSSAVHATLAIAARSLHPVDINMTLFDAQQDREVIDEMQQQNVRRQQALGALGGFFSNALQLLGHTISSDPEWLEGVEYFVVSRCVAILDSIGAGGLNDAAFPLRADTAIDAGDISDEPVSNNDVFNENVTFISVIDGDQVENFAAAVSAITRVVDDNTLAQFVAQNASPVALAAVHASRTAGCSAAHSPTSPAPGDYDTALTILCEARRWLNLHEQPPAHEGAGAVEHLAHVLDTCDMQLPSAGPIVLAALTCLNVVVRVANVCDPHSLARGAHAAQRARRIISAVAPTPRIGDQSDALGNAVHTAQRTWSARIANIAGRTPELQHVVAQALCAADDFPFADSGSVAMAIDALWAVRAALRLGTPVQALCASFTTSIMVPFFGAGGLAAWIHAMRGANSYRDNERALVAEVTRLVDDALARGCYDGSADASWWTERLSQLCAMAAPEVAVTLVAPLALTRPIDEVSAGLVTTVFSHVSAQLHEVDVEQARATGAAMCRAFVRAAAGDSSGHLVAGITPSVISVVQALLPTLVQTPADGLRVDWMSRAAWARQFSAAVAATARVAPTDQTCADAILTGIRLFRDVFTQLHEDDSMTTEHEQLRNRMVDAVVEFFGAQRAQHGPVSLQHVIQAFAGPAAEAAAVADAARRIESGVEAPRAVLAALL